MLAQPIQFGGVTDIRFEGVNLIQIAKHHKSSNTLDDTTTARCNISLAYKIAGKYKAPKISLAEGHALYYMLNTTDQMLALLDIYANDIYAVAKNEMYIELLQAHSERNTLYRLFVATVLVGPSAMIPNLVSQIETVPDEVAFYNLVEQIHASAHYDTLIQLYFGDQYVSEFLLALGDALLASAFADGDMKRYNTLLRFIEFREVAIMEAIVAGLSSKFVKKHDIMIRMAIHNIPRERRRMYHSKMARTINSWNVPILMEIVDQASALMALSASPALTKEHLFAYDAEQECWPANVYTDILEESLRLYSRAITNSFVLLDQQILANKQYILPEHAWCAFVWITSPVLTNAFYNTNKSAFLFTIRKFSANDIIDMTDMLNTRGKHWYDWFDGKLDILHLAIQFIMYYIQRSSARNIVKYVQDKTKLLETTGMISRLRFRIVLPMRTAMSEQELTAFVMKTKYPKVVKEACLLMFARLERSW